MRHVSILRPIAIAVLSLVVVFVLLAGGAVAWVLSLDLRAFAEREAGDALGRKVTIGALRVGWGDPLSVEIRDLRIANAPWGSRPEMASVEHVFALIDVRPLLQGTIRYRRLDVTQPDILLERDAKGAGNWKFDGGGSGGGFAVMPKDRTQFPTLLDFTLHDARITYRTTSGKPLVVALQQAAVRTSGEDQPIAVTADGAYNDLPAHLEATTDPFTTLRDAATPFGEAFTLSNADSTIAFKGRLMNPLDFDALEAALTIESGNFGKLLEAFDAGLPAAFAANLSGDFARQGDHWQIDGIAGAMAGSAVNGRFVLDEGPRGGADRIAIKARYDTLALERMIGKSDAGGGKDWKSIALELPGRTAPEIKADLAAKRLTYGKTALSDFTLAGTLGPGALELDSLKFALAGTGFEANGSARTAEKSTRLSIDAGLPGGDINALLDALGAPTDLIAGQVSARISLDATGRTLGEAVSGSQGTAVFAMIDGRISRDLLEKASTDLRTLFRKGKGMSAVRCLLGIAAVKDGVAKVSPLILRTPEATLNGGGTIDLARETLDLTIRSDPKSTGFFALDIPIRISGKLAAPKAAPDSKSDFKASLAPPELPGAIRRVAENSRCLGG